jgi:DNA-binding transcriptional ArsR family regulator
MQVKGDPLPEVVDADKVRTAREELPDDEALQDAVEVFKSLANPTRLRIVHALAHAEITVGDLAHAFGLTLSAVSHQLAVLRRLKLVAAREEGRQTFYRVTNPFVAHLVHDSLAHAEASGTGARHHHTHAPAEVPTGKRSRRSR